MNLHLTLSRERSTVEILRTFNHFKFDLVHPKYPPHADLRCFVHVRTCWGGWAGQFLGSRSPSYQLSWSSSSKLCSNFELFFSAPVEKKSIWLSTELVEVFAEANPWVGHAPWSGSTIRQILTGLPNMKSVLRMIAMIAQTHLTFSQYYHCTLDLPFRWILFNWKKCQN